MRNEYPRMDFRRTNFQILNGKWNFKFDDSDKGVKENWVTSFPNDYQEIVVPFCYQSALSGINDRTKHDVIWYNKKFITESKSFMLNFGAIDYECDVFLNKEHIMYHEGGETPFSIMIDNDKTEQEVTIRVCDPLEDQKIQRGKQIWKEQSEAIWYTPTSGIWQSVWIDYVDECKVDNLKTYSSLENGVQTIEISTSKQAVGKEMMIIVKDQDTIIYEGITKIKQTNNIIDIEMYHNDIFRVNYHDRPENICWSPENPKLFDYSVKIIDDQKVVDEVHSYFGFREISIEDGKTLLNNNPYYFKLVLDQGYFKEGILSAPEDVDYKNDILLAKQMGFNGCRKHQKVEDPRFLYWADKLGFLVWGEVASIPLYSDITVERMQKEWFEILKRDFNHPCIVAWVPLNESWGVPFIRNSKKQQSHSQALYYQIKSIDQTRLVLSNDGWEQTVTDICAIHNYNHGNIDEKSKVEHFKLSLKNKENLLTTRPANKPIYVKGFSHNDDVPIMLTEFGGISYNTEIDDGWGYTNVDSSEKLINEYARIVEVIQSSEDLFGFVYTQLSDVEQETNGFVTYDRKPKCDLNEIKKINDSIFIKY